MSGVGSDSGCDERSDDGVARSGGGDEEDGGEEELDCARCHDGMIGLPDMTAALAVVAREVETRTR